MAGRGHQGRADAALVRPSAVGAAGLLGVSLGVLGWLLAQAATFGVAEHTHLTAAGVTSHSHGYAAPLAAGAGVTSLFAVLMLLVLHLGSARTRSTPLDAAIRTARPTPVASVGSARRGSASRVVVLLTPVVAASLFTVVEAVEFAGSGAPAAAVAAVMALGVVFQLITAKAAVAATRAVVCGIEDLTRLPLAPPHSNVLLTFGGVTAFAGIVERTGRRLWDGRAPPAHLAVPVPSS